MAAPWMPNVGAQLVVEVMNQVKQSYPFVDLLKPETLTVLHILGALDTTLAWVRNAKQRLQDLVTQYPGQRARLLGLLANTEKREAALSHARALRTDARASTARRARHFADMWTALARARKLYFSCYEQERTPY